MKRISFLPLAALLAGLAIPAYGWNRIGHMVVAGIACDELSAAELQKLKGILMQLEDKDRLVEGLGSQDPNARDLIMAAATWPDLIKQDRTHFHDHGYDEELPVDLSHRDFMHKGWHFIDIPYDIKKKKDGEDPEDVTIVEVLKALDNGLKASPPDAMRAWELAWVLHLVGDIHQPLHCIDGFDKQNPKGDTGGNDIRVRNPEDEKVTSEKELHALWDDLLGANARFDSKAKRVPLDKDVAKADKVISQLPKNPKAVTINFMEWARESHKLAVEHGYQKLDLSVEVVSKGKHDEPTPVDVATITAEYEKRATTDAEQQAALAGHRLATMLKDYLK